MQKLFSFYVQNTSDTVVSVNGQTINASIQDFCSQGLGYELDTYDGDIFIVFGTDLAAPSITLNNGVDPEFTVDGKPHFIEIVQSLVGGRPDDRFKQHPTK